MTTPDPLFPYEPNRIVLEGRGRYQDVVSSAGFYPGHLLAKASTGKYAKFTGQASLTKLVIAVENALVGKTINDAYGADETCGVYEPVKGDKLYVRIPAAATALVDGDLMMSNGDGTFAKRTSTNAILLIADEAVDNSGGASEVFIRASVA